MRFAAGLLDAQCSVMRDVPERWTVSVSGAVANNSLRRFFVHDPDWWRLLNAVVDAIQVMTELLIHHVVRRVAAMSALMKIDRHRKPVGLHLIVDAYAVLGHDVPIIESVRQQHGGLDVLHEWKKIAPRSEVVVIAGRAITSAGCREEAIAVRRVAVRALCRIAAVNEVVDEVDVLAQPSTRMTHQSVRAV